MLLQEKPGAAWEPPPARDQEPFGFAVEDPPRDDGDHGRGVRVASIDFRGCAYRAGLREGDLILEIDGQPVIDKAMYRKAILNASPVARFYVRRGGKALFFGVRREAPLAARGRSGSSGNAAR